jgi:hypothetical protein
MYLMQIDLSYDLKVEKVFPLSWRTLFHYDGRDKFNIFPD